MQSTPSYIPTPKSTISLPSVMHPTTSSYENRVRDIQSYVKQLKSVSQSVEDARHGLENLKEHCISDVFRDRLAQLDSAERDAIEFIRELYENERNKLYKLLRPIDSELEIIDYHSNAVASAVEFAAEICGERRSIAVVDKHQEIVRRISRTISDVNPLIKNRNNAHIYKTLLEKVKISVNNHPQTPPIYVSTTQPDQQYRATSPHSSPSSDCSIEDIPSKQSELLTLSPLKLDDMQPPSDGSVRVYVTLDSLGHLKPFYDVTSVSPACTVVDLLLAVASRLGGDASAFSAQLRRTQGGTFFPLRRAAALLEELQDFRDLDDEPGWPRIFVSAERTQRGS